MLEGVVNAHSLATVLLGALNLLIGLLFGLTTGTLGFV